MENLIDKELMEEIVIRAYVYRSLSNMLHKIHKLHPDILPDDLLEYELERLKEYVKTIKVGEHGDDDTANQSTGDTTNNSTTPGVAASAEPSVNTEKQVKAPKAKRQPRKVKVPVAQDLPVNTSSPQITFNTNQFQGVLPTVSNTPSSTSISTSTTTTVPVNVKSKPKSKPAPVGPVATCQCVARVVSNGRGVMSYDYMSYSNNATVPVYGRQCKNVRIEGSQFCLVHNKKYDYGIFTEEATDTIKDMCLRKYNRCKEIEDKFAGSAS